DQIYADHLELAVFSLAEDLSVVEFRIRGCASGQMNRVPQTGSPIGEMVSRVTDRPVYRDHRRIFKIKPAENPNCVKWFENKILVFSRQSIIEIEGQHDRRIIGRGQPNDLCVTLGWFRKKIAIGLDDIRHFHAIAVGEPPGREGMASRYTALSA